MGNLFIAFEGPDGSGKGTQVDLFKKYLNDNGINAYFTHEPTEGPIGKLIRQVLSGSVKLTTEALQTLFTADRIEHQKEIEDNLNNGFVVTDRYYASTISYIQTINIKKEILDEITKLNYVQMKPDVWIYLRCTVEESIKSIANRNGVPEIYDKKEKLELILSAYDKFFAAQDNVIIADRNGRLPDEIHKEIISKLKIMGIL